MPIFRLTEELIFPPPRMATRSGLLAVGGDLRPERLLLAYRMGIFPWYSAEEPILWWSPNPRLVLFPGEFHCPRRLERTIRSKVFTVTMDTKFDDVIARCATIPRPDQDGTWITQEMQEAYSQLHKLGYAHSVESWKEGKLVGGVYGVSLGRAFFGESMFSDEPNASKVALAKLVECARNWSFTMIDCQVTTEHLQALGAREIDRAKFLKLLETSLEYPTRAGKWSLEE